MTRGNTILSHNYILFRWYLAVAPANMSPLRALFDDDARNTSVLEASFQLDAAIEQVTSSEIDLELPEDPMLLTTHTGTVHADKFEVAQTNHYNLFKPRQ